MPTLRLPLFLYPRVHSFIYYESYRVELHLSGLNGTASHMDMQKIRIIGFFFENKLHLQFEVGKYIQTDVLGYVYIYVQIQH